MWLKVIVEEAYPGRAEPECCGEGLGPEQAGTQPAYRLLCIYRASKPESGALLSSQYTAS